MNAPPYFTFMPLHRHFDGGFGAIGDAFKEAGDQLGKIPASDMHKHLPATYLYRHAIEMYLKSMIVIIHKRFDASSKRPQVLFRRKWRAFDTVHTLAGSQKCLQVSISCLDRPTLAQAFQRKFQVMAEICRKISSYTGQEFHLMPELSS